MEIALIVAVVILAGVGLFVMLKRARPSQGLEDRINELAALGQPLSLEELELSQPFAQRVLVPMMQGISNLAQKMTPQSNLEAAQHKLELAGLAHKIKPAQFFVARIAGAVIGAFLGFVLVTMSSDVPLSRQILMIVGGIVFGYYLPQLLLSSKISKRQEDVLKSLPDALDLLTICVEAGLGFDASMSKVAEKWDNELSLAFNRTVQEMQLGKLRREALRNMANSLDVSDVTSFVAAIVQADQLGVSMAKVMRIQSEQMRMKRRQRAEEKARSAPVKIMIPLVFFIFPTILIVLLGPAILQIKNSGVLGGL
ncbi:MAG: type II secretion system F family protein [Anaerolineae bacterium]|jgi:tight adherence protein C|nr:type II secretion system F family protein [Anaerolineae bacterium]